MSGEATRSLLQHAHASAVSQSCFDLMLIELVPMAERIAARLHLQEVSVGASQGNKASKLEGNEFNDALYYRLDMIGYRVGLGVVEGLSANAPLLATAAASTSGPGNTTTTAAAALDSIKFLCKDVWNVVFRKQIDNLKTNHRGVFVLTDNRFDPLKRCSLPTVPAGAVDADRILEASRRAGNFLVFPAGLIRGALSGLGIEAAVNAEVAPVGLPGAVFNIRLEGSK